MRLIEFQEQTAVIAKDQPQYQSLPAHIDLNDEYGTVTCCWKLSFAERIKLLFTGKIWHQILTFKMNLQPQKLMIDKPEL